MSHIVSIDPFRCRLWNGHERLEDQINEQTCRAEIDSFVSHGQMIPVLGRPAVNDIEYSFELIYGARRLFVARHLNVPLLAEIREISDRDAITALDTENRLRKELSPYERGRCCKTWLRNGIFRSQDELARALNVSASQVSRLLKLAQLPPVLLSAFASPTDVCENWGAELMQLWENPEKRRKLASRARALSLNSESRRLESASVFKHLVGDDSLRGKSRVRAISDGNAHDEVVKDEEGKPLFRVRVHRNNVALLLPTTKLSEQLLREIKSHVSGVLQRDDPERTIRRRRGSDYFRSDSKTSNTIQAAE